MNSELVTAFEMKAAPDAATGVFEGYGAIFGNIDSHGDVIMPGAFKASLARGSSPLAFHVEHHWAKGGSDHLPAGIWTDLVEDDRGLRAKGKISGLETEYGKRVHALMKDGALQGLSIVYNVPPGGAERLNLPVGAKRALKTIDLVGIDVVKFPSNTMARVDEVKDLLAMADRHGAAKAVAGALAVHLSSMQGGDSPTADERASLLNHLQNAHEALTGRRMPHGMKAAPTTIREFEAMLRESFGMSNAEARDIAERGFKSLPRDEGDTQAVHEATSALKSALSGFKLSS